MQIVKRGVEFRTRRHRWTTEHHNFSGGVGSLAYIVHPAALDVHAADKDRIGPSEVPGTRRPHVFIDEADIPRIWKHRRDDKQALWRHERANPAGQRIGVFEGAERRDITGKYAKNVPRVSILGG